MAMSSFDLRLALRASLPIAMGYIPLGMAYGLLLVQSGLPWWLAPLSGVFVFAGAMQFLAVGLLTTHTSLVAIAFATFTVNFRHLFYGLSFPYARLDTAWRRSYGVFALTDETYSLLAGRKADALTGRQIHLIQMLSHAYWVTGGLVGALASVALPKGIQGIDFALTALFVVLALEHGKGRHNLVPVVNGVLAGMVAFVIGGDHFLSVALGTLFILTIMVYLIRRKEGSHGDDVPAERRRGDGGDNARAAGGSVCSTKQDR